MAAVAVKRPAYSGPYATLINKSARRNGIDAWLLAALLYVESKFKPTATSATGDVGIAQINLASHPAVSAAEARDPNFAIPWAARYLSNLKQQTGSTTAALRAYNTGSGAQSAAGTAYANKVLNARRDAIQATRALGSSALNSSGFAGVDQGVDFTGKGSIPALAAGRITYVGTETDIEGQTGSLVVERLSVGPERGKYVYVAENFKPTVRQGQTVKAGQMIGFDRGITSQGTGIEIGFNRGATGWDPVSPLGADPHAPTPAGEKMLAYLDRLTRKAKGGGGTVPVSAHGQPIGFWGDLKSGAGFAIDPAFGVPGLGGGLLGSVPNPLNVVKGAYDSAKAVGELAARILTDPGYIFLWVGFAIIGLAFIFLGMERLLGRSAGADARRGVTLVAAPEAAPLGVGE